MNMMIFVVLFVGGHCNWSERNKLRGHDESNMEGVRMIPYQLVTQWIFQFQHVEVVGNIWECDIILGL